MRRSSSVKECALRARSTHGVHHAIVEVDIVIGVVLGEVLVAHVVPLVVDAVIGLAFGLIAHVIVVFFVVAILHGISCMGDILLTDSVLCLAKKSINIRNPTKLGRTELQEYEPRKATEIMMLSVERRQNSSGIFSQDSQRCSSVTKSAIF